MPELSKSPQFYSMDALRACAMLVGIYYHSTINWTGLEDVSTNVIPGIIGNFFHFFRMQTFFLIADSSYWLYLAHGPVLMYLQIEWAYWPLAWYLKIPLLNITACGNLIFKLPSPGTINLAGNITQRPPLPLPLVRLFNKKNDTIYSILI